MNPEVKTIELFNHFTVLIYPFLHRITPQNRRQQLQRLAKCWQPWWTRLETQDVERALDDTYFFLPYIRELLFPETVWLQGTPTRNNYQAQVKKIRDQGDDLQQFFMNPQLPNDAVWRITYAPEKLASLAHFNVIAINKNGAEAERIPASFEWIDTVLFSAGIGFLVAKVKLKADCPSLSQLLDLNYYLRMVHPPTVDWKLPKLEFESNIISVRDLMDFLTQGIAKNEPLAQAQRGSWGSSSQGETVSHSPINDDLANFVSQLPSSQRYSETAPGQIYGERCQLLSYAGINLTDEQRNHLPQGQFPDLENRLLYEFATCTAQGDAVTNPASIPAPEQVEQLQSENRISVWRCWQAMALKETAVFLATENIGFNQNGLPHNIENDYLPLYLYTLSQKFQLFDFSDKLMGKETYVKQNLQRVRKLTDQFVRFRSQSWFNEVTRKPLGSELYRKFQQGLEIPILYELVLNEVNEIQEYYEERSSRQINSLLNALTFLLVPLGTIISIFALPFVKGSFIWFGITCIVTLLISFLIWLWWQRKK